MSADDKLDIPQGTLDLMILTILSREPLHGYGIAQRQRTQEIGIRMVIGRGIASRVASRTRGSACSASP